MKKILPKYELKNVIVKHIFYLCQQVFWQQRMYEWICTFVGSDFCETNFGIFAHLQVADNELTKLLLLLNRIDLNGAGKELLLIEESAEFKEVRGIVERLQKCSEEELDEIAGLICAYAEKLLESRFSE